MDRISAIDVIIKKKIMYGKYWLRNNCLATLKPGAKIKMVTFGWDHEMNRSNEKIIINPVANAVSKDWALCCSLVLNIFATKGGNEAPSRLSLKNVLIILAMLPAKMKASDSALTPLKNLNNNASCKIPKALAVMVVAITVKKWLLIFFFFI